MELRCYDAEEMLNGVQTAAWWIVWATSQRPLRWLVQAVPGSGLTGDIQQLARGFGYM